jgi:hypothetical protein
MNYGFVLTVSLYLNLNLFDTTITVSCMIAYLPKTNTNDEIAVAFTTFIRI